MDVKLLEKLLTLVFARSVRKRWERWKFWKTLLQEKTYVEN